MNGGTKMLYTYFTEELIGLQDLILEKIESNEKEIHIYGKVKRKAHRCPDCSAETEKIHDYREQVIKISLSMAKQHIFICTNDVIVVNAENVFMNKTHFYLVTTGEPTDCQRILLTG
jgi:transposase